MCEATTVTIWSQTRIFRYYECLEQRNALRGTTQNKQIRTTLEKNISEIYQLAIELGTLLCYRGHVI